MNFYFEIWVIPYVQQYEFEALLFSDPEYYQEYFGKSTIGNEMKKIIALFHDDIEEINDSPQTAPSKRIETLFEKIGEHYKRVTIHHRWDFLTIHERKYAKLSP